MLGIFIILNLIDASETYYLLNHGASEANFLPALGISVLGLLPALSCKMLLAVGIGLAIHRIRPSLFLPLNIGMGLVVATCTVSLVSLLKGLE